MSPFIDMNSQFCNNNLYFTYILGGTCQGPHVGMFGDIWKSANLKPSINKTTCYMKSRQKLPFQNPGLHCNIPQIIIITYNNGNTATSDDYTQNYTFLLIIKHIIIECYV